MIVIAIPLLVAIVGLLIFALSGGAAYPPTSKVAEIGRIMFFCGLLVALWVAAGDKATWLK